MVVLFTLRTVLLAKGFTSLHPKTSHDLLCTLSKVLLDTIDISFIMITSSSLYKLRNLYLI